MIYPIPTAAVGLVNLCSSTARSAVATILGACHGLSD